MTLDTAFGVSPRAGGYAVRMADHGGAREVDWAGIAASEEFLALEAARRRFVTAALSVFGIVVGAFLICCGYARDFMGSSVHGALTVAYTWLLSLTVLAWVIAYLYLRFSTRTLVPRAEEIARKAGLEDRGA
jgi:uncharacterized membrane protein (DUF485 family)